MPSARYEILLPLRYNEGTPVEPEKFQQTKAELLERFQGLTVEPGTVRGVWVYQGEPFEDELIRFVVDAEDEPETEQFFRDFKERLKERFRQLDIWVTSQMLVLARRRQLQGTVPPTRHLGDRPSIADPVVTQL